MTDAVRGAAVFIDVTFKDEAGLTVNPSSGSIRLSYYRRHILTTQIYSLANQGGGVWRYVWDSSVSDAGTVSYFAYTTDAPKAVAEGSFTLSANLSNPVPAP